MMPALTPFERAAGALIFALHAVKPHGVAWISGSTDPLLTLFFLSAVLLYLRYRRTGSALALGGTLACYAGCSVARSRGRISSLSRANPSIG